MSAKSFIDTNVFIYQLEALDQRKADIATHLIEEAISTGLGYISYQVVQECLNTIVRKAEIALDTLDARRYLETVLMPLWHIMPSSTLYQRALEVQNRYRYGFYDSLIIVSALSAGCTRLCSEDLQHGQRIEQLTIENPFMKS